MKRETSTKGESPKAKKPELDIISTGSSESTGYIGDPQFSSTPIMKMVEERVYKPDLMNSLEKLFLIDMSRDVLVDAIMYTNPEKNNKVTIVGRSKLVGSSTKQMRHVIPYSFIGHAIKAALTTPTGQGKLGNISYIDEVVNVIQPLINNKNGICVLQDKENNFFNFVEKFIEENEISGVLKFLTITQDKRGKTYYLIDDTISNQIIEEFNSSAKCAEEKLSEGTKEELKKLFNKKFSKYINYGIKYLKNKISSQNQDDPDTITLVCEGIARIILTMFNQDKYVAFPTEGNSLPQEVRLYKNKDSTKSVSRRSIKAQIEDKIFEVKSNTCVAGIIEKAISDGSLADYDERIRIVDNEGTTVKAVTDMLCSLNSLVGDENAESIDQQKCDSYNAEAKGLSIKICDQYSIIEPYQEVNEGNLHNYFHLHAARYLYAIFDLKPLEKKVFAAMQKDDTNTVKVYPSATGTKIAKYSVQDGQEYRELEVNRAAGYNDKVTFLSEITGERLKELLIEKIIIYMCYFSILYPQLCTGCREIDKQEEMNIEGEVKDERIGMRKILDSFIQLVAQDYNNAEYIDNGGVSTKLDQVWIEKVHGKYQAVYQESFSDKSNVSSDPAQENYSSMFRS